MLACHDKGLMASAPDCIPNIGPLERRKRLVFGGVTLGIGIVVAVVLAALGAPRLWRLPLFFLFWAAAIGFIQAWDKT